MDGNPFFIRGMCYAPSKIGECGYHNTLRDWMIADDDRDGQIDMAYQSWVDKNRNDIQDDGETVTGDFALLNAMGCNVIRVYHHPTGKFKIQALNPGHLFFNHAPNKKLLRDLHKKYGIWIMMGDYLGAYTIGSGASWDLGTDYRDAGQLRNMMNSVKDMVLEFKDEPYILMWALGNENNYKKLSKTNCSDYPVSFAQFLNEVTKWIHETDPNHPVCLVNGGDYLLDVYAKHAPEIDIFGLNAYPINIDFGMLWNNVDKIYDKPVLLTEFGDGHPQINNGLNEEQQSRVFKFLWMDIFNHASGRKAPGNAIGGFVFEWLDNWWQDGDPMVHNLAIGHHHLEWQGICAQGNGQHSPLLRQTRDAYYVRGLSTSLA